MVSASSREKKEPIAPPLVCGLSVLRGRNFRFRVVVTKCVEALRRAAPLGGGGALRPRELQRV